jgi:hypothetical protein
MDSVYGRSRAVENERLREVDGIKHAAEERGYIVAAFWVKFVFVFGGLHYDENLIQLSGYMFRHRDAATFRS